MLLHSQIFVISFVTLIEGKSYYKKILPRDNADVEFMISCINDTAKRLFYPGNRISIISDSEDSLETKLTKFLMTMDLTVSQEKPTFLKHGKKQSYIVIENEISKLREKFLVKDYRLRTLQYLFVYDSDNNSMSSFVRDLWYARVYSITFLMFDKSTNIGIVSQPHQTEDDVILKTLGHCSLTERNLDKIEMYTSRYCPKRSCVLNYGTILDETVNYWRNEERKGNKGMQFADVIINDFLEIYNATLNKISNNLSWDQASEMLRNSELDLVNGLMPTNVQYLNGIEIVCWYRFRYMVFAAQVRQRATNEMLQLAMPFSYSVWICIVLLSIFYFLLVYILRRFSQKKLIKERLRFIQIFEITLSQDVKFPKKTALRFVLALWILFSLYLNILYNSTFTSSLAKVYTEDLLKNLEELRGSGQPIAGPRVIQFYFNDSSDPVLFDLQSRYTVMTVDDALKAIFSNRTVSVIQQLTVDKMNWETRMNRSMRIYTLEEPQLVYPVLFFTRKAHPFRTLIRRLAMDNLETGLWERFLKFHVIEKDKYNSREVDSEILTMTHLRSVLYLFCILQAISVVMFFVELFQKSQKFKTTIKLLKNSMSFSRKKITLK